MEPFYLVRYNLHVFMDTKAGGNILAFIFLPLIRKYIWLQKNQGFSPPKHVYNYKKRHILISLNLVRKYMHIFLKSFSNFFFILQKGAETLNFQRFQPLFPLQHIFFIFTYKVQEDRWNQDFSKFSPLIPARNYCFTNSDFYCIL